MEHSFALFASILHRPVAGIDLSGTGQLSGVMWHQSKVLSVNITCDAFAVMQACTKRGVRHSGLQPLEE